MSIFFEQSVLYFSLSLAFYISVVQIQSSCSLITPKISHFMNYEIMLIVFRLPLPITHEVPDKSVEETYIFNSILYTVSDVKCNSSYQPANFSAWKVKQVERSFTVTANLEIAMFKGFTTLGTLLSWRWKQKLRASSKNEDHRQKRKGDYGSVVVALNVWIRCHLTAIRVNHTVSFRMLARSGVRDSKTVRLVTVWGKLHRLSVNCRSIAGRATGLSLIQSVRTGSGSHAWVPQTLSAWVYRPGREAHRSPQTTAGFVSPLPIRFHDVYGDIFFAFLTFHLRVTYSTHFSFSVTFSRSW